MRGKWLLAGGTIILVAIAAGALSLLRRSDSPPPAPSKAAAAPEIPAEVTLSGKIQAQHVVLVAATTDGIIEPPVVEVGEEVFEGQMLVRIKNTTLESARDRALLEAERARNKITNLDGSLIAARLEASRAGADASRARTEYERAEKLFQRQTLLYREGATPRLTFEKVQKEYLNVKAEYESLQLLAAGAEGRVEALVKDLDRARTVAAETEEELEQAQNDLLAAEVHAPVDGIVVARRAEPEQEVNRTIADLFQIAVDLSMLAVTVEPEPPVLARIQPGQPALVQVVEILDESLPATVKEVTESQVVVEFTSPLPAVKPGMTAQVRIKIG